MNKVIKDREEIIDIIEEAQELSSVPTKHDCHRTNYVAKLDGIDYLFWAEFSYNNGMMSDRITLQEAEQVEVIKKVWRAKNMIKVCW